MILKKRLKIIQEEKEDLGNSFCFTEISAETGLTEFDVKWETLGIRPAAVSQRGLRQESAMRFLFRGSPETETSAWRNGKLWEPVANRFPRRGI